MKHTETILEKECCNIARCKGLVAVKLDRNGHKGIPDRVFIQEGGKCLFVEFKRPDGKGKISDEQKFWRYYLGMTCSIIDSNVQFEELLKEYFFL